MEWIFKSQNLMALMAIPIAISTLLTAKKNWSSLWDDDLTGQDRSLLMRIAIFIIMPVIVFFHECGHAVATVQCGGEVEKFYYGFLWGYVIPRGTFTDLQVLWIYLAGNLVEILLGVVALTIAFVASAPSIVALGVYVFFWAVGGTLIFYTLLSVLGAYGDWQAIYASPLREAVYGIGVLHAIVVLFIIWAAYSKTTALWFARKTNPGMAEEERKLMARLAQSDSAANLIELAGFYYTHGVYKIANHYVDLVLKNSPEQPQALLISAWLKYAESKYEDAKKVFTFCAQSAHAEPLLQAKAYMGAADAQVQLTLERLRGADGKIEDWSEAVSLQSRAHDLVPELGDPLFYRAELFLRQHLYNRAENDFRDMLQKNCLDSRLFERARRRLAGLKQDSCSEQ
jgi:hypothetical protein